MEPKNFAKFICSPFRYDSFNCFEISGYLLINPFTFMQSIISCGKIKLNLLITSFIKFCFIIFFLSAS